MKFAQIEKFVIKTKHTNKHSLCDFKNLIQTKRDNSRQKKYRWENNRWENLDQRILLETTVERHHVRLQHSPFKLQFVFQDTKVTIRYGNVDIPTEL